MPSWKRSCKKPPPPEQLPSPPRPPVPRARRQHFPLLHVRLVLRGILHIPMSLRAAVANIGLIGDEGFTSAEAELDEVPTAECGRWWLLRVGLYEIRRPKEQAEDWIWLVDHTIQLGTTRVLVIVGVRVSAWEAGGRGALKHQDLQVLLLEPVQKSNADVVQAQLERAAQAGGAPRAIVSDQSRELGLAIEQFQAAHPQTLHLHDIKHRLALFLEHRLKPDPRWGEFLSACQTMRKKSQQTPLAFLSPPATKEKARFMNVDSLIRWATLTGKFLDNPQMPPGQTLDRERLESVFGELRQHEAAVSQWQSLIDLIDLTLEHVRQDGYYAGCAADLRRTLTPAAADPEAQDFVEDVVAFVRQQSVSLAPREHLPGSSEVIESLIGKGKRLEGQQSKSGFTRMVLGLAAAVVKPTNEYLQQALETVGVKHVAQWAKQHLGPSIQALRQQTLGRLSAEQKRDKDPAPATAGF